MRGTGGDDMKKVIGTVLVGLVVVSLISTYYTMDLKQRETERGHSFSEEIAKVQTQIQEVTSLISEAEGKKSETATLILEEQEKQKGIEAQIEAKNLEKSEIEDKIDLYKKIAERDPRVFITLDDPVVKAKVEEVTRLCRTREERQQAIFEYVRKETEYATEGNPKKWSYPKPYLHFKSEFWQLPRETIEWGNGDCEDVSILLCTMMRIAGVPASDIRIVLGFAPSEGVGHAWTEFKMGDHWYALESTCPTCNYMDKDYYYEVIISNLEVWGWFNDVEYHEFPQGKTSSARCVLV